MVPARCLCLWAILDHELSPDYAFCDAVYTPRVLCHRASVEAAVQLDNPFQSVLYSMGSSRIASYSPGHAAPASRLPVRRPTPSPALSKRRLTHVSPCMLPLGAAVPRALAEGVGVLTSISSLQRERLGSKNRRNESSPSESEADVLPR